MEEFIKIVLQSGKTALDLGLYVLLPVLVVMMALMKVVEARGILALVARLVQPVLRLFGVPGAGAFAIMQLLFVSFAAPLATLPARWLAVNHVSHRLDVRRGCATSTTDDVDPTFFDKSFQRRGKRGWCFAILAFLIRQSRVRVTRHGSRRQFVDRPDMIGHELGAGGAVQTDSK